MMAEHEKDRDSLENHGVVPGKEGIRASVSRILTHISNYTTSCAVIISLWEEVREQLYCR